jgi:hypothetical protein
MSARFGCWNAISGLYSSRKVIVHGADAQSRLDGIGRAYVVAMDVPCSARGRKSVDAVCGVVSDHPDTVSSHLDDRRPDGGPEPCRNQQLPAQGPRLHERNPHASRGSRFIFARSCNALSRIFVFRFARRSPDRFGENSRCRFHSNSASSACLINLPLLPHFLAEVLPVIRARIAAHGLWMMQVVGSLSASAVVAQYRVTAVRFNLSAGGQENPGSRREAIP